MEIFQKPQWRFARNPNGELLETIIEICQNPNGELPEALMENCQKS
jgi:hypothetical protein